MLPRIQHCRGAQSSPGAAVSLRRTISDMGRMVAGAARLRLAFAIMLSGALSLLLPSLLATNVDVSSVVVLTAVVAMMIAVLRPGRHTIPVDGSTPGPPRGAEEVPSFLAARVTDTARHPVRPRAPGVV